MTSKTEKRCDVLIIGAGMAGGCLARQLKRAMPDLSIVNLEKKKEFDYHIGESTVEVWVDYAYRVLGLGPYLMKNHIVKHGLRFFYDSEKKDLPVHEMSENGRDRYSTYLHSHQLDRQKFDQDLVDMNLADGIDVRMGCAVVGSPEEAITIDRDGGHLVQTSDGPIRCRWLVDAAGRQSPLARKLDLVTGDERHPSASYWGRFKNTRILDELGTDEWRRRVSYTMRHFSTNHMMYPGYWWWLIPVSHDVLSIGVELDKRIDDRKCRNADELVAFIKEHRWGRDLLGDDFEVLDFMGFSETARKAKQYYSHDRWFLTGMSGLVIDALYSTTGITTAYSNRLVGELIKTDRSGDDARFRRQLHHFNIWMRMRYEYFLWTIDNYEKQGSFETMIGLRQAFQSTFHNVRVPEGTEDLAGVIKQADAHAKGCDCSLEKELKAMETSMPAAIRRLSAEFCDFLKKTGNYYAGNRGGFSEGTERESLARKYYKHPRDLAEENEENLVTFEALVRHFLGRMAHYSDVAWNEAAFARWFVRDWNADQTLADGMKALRKGGLKVVGKAKVHGHAKSNGHVVWNAKGPVTTAPANETEPLSAGWTWTKKPAAATRPSKGGARAARKR